MSSVAFLYPVLLLTQQSQPVVLSPGRQAMHPEMMVAIVEFDGIVRHVNRSASSGETPAKALNVAVHAKSGSAPLKTLVGGASIKPFEKANGRFALVYSTSYPKLMGMREEFQAQAGDAAAFFAIQVPSTFRLKDNESPRVFCYRALAANWSQLSPARLQKALDSMPQSGPEELSKPSQEFSPDSRAIAELAASLEPIRRIVVLSDLTQANQLAAYPPLSEAVWEARNMPELALITLPSSLNPPTAKRLHGNRVLQECLESTKIDAVRALYIRSIAFDGSVDYKGLARLLRTSGPLAQHEIVIGISNHKSDPNWNYSTLTPEQQRDMLGIFVQHWLSFYGV